MDLLVVKILTMSLLGGLSLLIGLLPLVLKRCCRFFQSDSAKTGSVFLSSISCFGGGVILTTCFTHMIPEVNQFLSLNIEKGAFPKTGKFIHKGKVTACMMTFLL